VVTDIRGGCPYGLIKSDFLLRLDGQLLLEEKQRRQVVPRLNLSRRFQGNALLAKLLLHEAELRRPKGRGLMSMALTLS